MRNMPRVFTSFMPNAPLLAGVPGAALDVFKKCLNTGWTPFDITSIVVLNGIGTINFNYPDCELPDYCYLTITGCSEPQLNTEVCIEKGFATMGEFKTTVADGTYNAALNNTIKAVPSPAGWDLLFSGANVAVLRSGNPDSSLTAVRFDDTRATSLGFDFGSDALSIDQMVDTPNFANNNRNYFKAFNASATSYRNWCIIADNSTVYFVFDSNSAQYSKPGRAFFNGGRWCGFGDYTPNNPTNPHPFFYWLSAIDHGNGNYHEWGDDTPWVAGPANFTNVYARAAIRSASFSNSQWAIGSFTVGQTPTNNIIRISGTSTPLSALFNETIFSGFRKPPVNTNFNGLSYEMGYLPGILFADYHLRTFVQKFFAAKKSSVSDDIVLLTPLGGITRSTDDYQPTYGVIPFVINKRWGV